MRNALLFAGLLLAVRDASCAAVPATSLAEATPVPTHAVASDAVTAEIGAPGGVVELKDNPPRGLYLVNHFSPYCPHCQALAPIYSQLPALYPHTSITFAKIDCVANGDLCSDHGITAYPTIEIWKDGKRVSRFPASESTTLENLKAFVEKEVAKSKGKLPSLANAPNPSKTEPVDRDDEIKEADKTVAAVPASVTTNLAGTSTPLSEDSFHRLITTTRNGWFVKFYAPWCGHCKAMAPAWMELAKEMRGKLNIGEVNCEEEKRLCKDVKLRGFPTLLFLQGGERIEYDGLRGLGDLVSFANKAVNAGVHEIDAADFEQIEKKEEVIFLYFYDQATVSEDFEAIRRTALSLIGHAPLLKTSSDILAGRFRVTTFPRLVAVRDGRPSYYTALSPRDMRDHKKLLAWMKSVWLPILPELSASNSHEIMQGRTVVLAILDRNHEHFERSKREMKAAALEWMDVRAGDQKQEKQEQRDRKELKIEEAEDKGDERAIQAAKNIHIRLKERKEVGFAWVDGVFWERWLKTTYGIDVRSQGERVIINDEDRKQFWDVTLEGNPIEPSRSAVLETVQAALAQPPKIKSKSSQSSFENVIFVARGMGQGHPLAILLIGVMMLFSAAFYTMRKWRKTVSRRLSLSLGNGHSPTKSSSVSGKFD